MSLSLEISALFLDVHVSLLIGLPSYMAMYCWVEIAICYHCLRNTQPHSFPAAKAGHWTGYLASSL